MSAELKWLEKVFAAEIEGRMFQSKAAIMKRLEAAGYVEAGVETIPPDRSCPFPVTIRGWNLTHLGRLTYCMSCDKRGGDVGER